jgi:hypothetical protein
MAIGQYLSEQRFAMSVIRFYTAHIKLRGANAKTDAKSHLNKRIVVYRLSLMCSACIQGPKNRRIQPLCVCNLSIVRRECSCPHDVIFS